MSIFKHTYSGLITGGLGNSACCGLITMQFHVFKCKIEVIVPSGGGGGSYPLAPGQIQNFFKPVNPGKFHIPRDTLQQTIIVKITMNGKVTTKEYKTYPVVAKIIAKIINIKDVTRDAVKIRVDYIKNKFDNVIAIIKRINNKKEYITPDITNVKNKE